MAKYIPVRKTITAPELAEVFISNIVRNFGTPDSIVTDRERFSQSKFWSPLYNFIKAGKRQSTAFHQKTDGKTKRKNQTLENYLQPYWENTQNDWVKSPNMANFAYKNSITP